VISVHVCRQRLATVWFIGAGLIVALQVAQTIAGRFGDHVDQAWGWLLPNVMPTSTLIVAVLVQEALGENPRASQAVDVFLYRLTLGLCAAYLLLLLVTMLAQPLSSTPIISMMEKSNLWLGPVQGLATAALGAFFIKGEAKGSRTE
jgi:hypothetical protein